MTEGQDNRKWYQKAGDAFKGIGRTIKSGYESAKSKISSAPYKAESFALLEKLKATLIKMVEQMQKELNREATLRGRENIREAKAKKLEELIEKSEDKFGVKNKKDMHKIISENTKDKELSKDKGLSKDSEIPDREYNTKENRAHVKQSRRDQEELGLTYKIDDMHDRDRNINSFEKEAEKELSKLHKKDKVDITQGINKPKREPDYIELHQLKEVERLKKNPNLDEIKKVRQEMDENLKIRGGGKLSYYDAKALSELNAIEKIAKDNTKWKLANKTPFTTNKFKHNQNVKGSMKAKEEISNLENKKPLFGKNKKDFRNKKELKEKEKLQKKSKKMTPKDFDKTMKKLEDAGKLEDIKDVIERASSRATGINSKAIIAGNQLGTKDVINKAMNGQSKEER